MTSRSETLGTLVNPFRFDTQCIHRYWYGGKRWRSLPHRVSSSSLHCPRPAGLRPGSVDGREVANVGNAQLGSFFVHPGRCGQLPGAQRSRIATTGLRSPTEVPCRPVKPGSTAPGHGTGINKDRLASKVL